MKKSLRQYFNITGIISSIKVFTNKDLLRPTLRYKSITDIDLVLLKEDYKIKCIVFDKDNTLTDPKDNSFPLNISSKLEDFKKAFGKENLAIISNTAGSKDDKNHTVFKCLIREADKIHRDIDIYVIRHEHQKPNVKKEVLGHFRNYDSKQICIIGDRLMIDVLMGNEFGCCTILTEPLNPKAENKMIQLARKFEDYLLNKYLNL